MKSQERNQWVVTKKIQIKAFLAIGRELSKSPEKLKNDLPRPHTRKQHRASLTTCSMDGGLQLACGLLLI